MATTATKTARTLIASASLAVAGTASGSLDLRTTFGALVTVRVTNGGTGPTVAPTVTINVSTDNGTWRQYTAVQSNTGNSVVTDFVFDIPATVMYVQVSITGNTGQAVTVEALAHEFTSFG